MGATVPAIVRENSLSRLMANHLPRVHQGKVRDTYASEDPNVLLVQATDRISIFDFVLGDTLPRKGEVLTALTVFWLTRLFVHDPHHLITYGKHIDAYLPQALKNNPQIRRRTIAVRKKEMFLVECIARGYLTGSGWGAYKESGEVCGIRLAEGLHDGSQLPEAIFTPTTKAEVGHDEHLDAAEVIARHGDWSRRQTLYYYNRAREYAAERGVIIADTKFEFAADGTLADEVLTPDSSRFWDKGEYEAAVANRKSPAGFDKELVRQAGKQAVISGEVVDISKLKPTNPEHVSLAARWQIPAEVQDLTMERYRAIQERIMGMDLDLFQDKTLQAA